MIDPVVIFGWDPRGEKSPSEHALFLTTPLTFPPLPKNPPRYFPYLPRIAGYKKIVALCLESVLDLDVRLDQLPVATVEDGRDRGALRLEPETADALSLG